MNTQQGLILVYTGDGKGKTSAALGAALRALGHGLKICLIRFVKEEKRFSGETASLGAFGESCRIVTAGSGFILSDDPRHREAAIAGWVKAREIILSDSFDMVILDEISYIINLGFLAAEEVTDCLAKRPGRLHVVLTGRGMPEPITAIADCVTEMTMRKHPYERGMTNIQGIDY